ncbi:MAG: PDZ domain-containing protein [Candidatus Marinimicrobia bacterium]|nr:PDZ domain-containing protein [Candidatus Neomarinimicrobiota bacterium]
MINHFILFSLLLGVTMASTKNRNDQIIYHLSMPEPHTHYFHVSMELKAVTESTVRLKMPVWTPGSYLVREFSRNVPRVTAFAGDEPLTVEKTSKNEWQVALDGHSDLLVEYRVYAYEQSVRTSFLNDSRGYVNGASVFIYPEGMENEPGELKVRPFNKWHTISTGLEKIPGKRQTYRFANYDILVDSPILIGNHKVLKFTVDGTQHEIALYGEGSVDENKLVDDVQKIVEATRGIFGGFPYDRYVFLFLLLDGARGGLEHLNSTTIQVDRWAFTDEKKYRGFLSTVAHEFFHTWNVKRIRPIALGPFDYTKENYTKDLWIAEGLTSYYDNLILLRSGIIDEKGYFDFLSKDIKNVETFPGRLVQSATEASFDAWIKYYRRNEESPNTQISYYSKGAVVGLLLDLAILEHTAGEKSLDDVFRQLNESHSDDPKKGYTSDEFRQTCESVAGRSLQDVWRHADTTEEVDYGGAFETFGVEFVKGYSEGRSEKTPYYGFETRGDSNPVVKTVFSGTPAYESGVNVNDEIVAVDDVRVSSQSLNDHLERSRIGEAVTLLITREGLMRSLQIVPVGSPPDLINLKKIVEASSEQRQRFEWWLRVPWKE